MADENPRMRLGRGLAALLGDVGNEESAETRHRSQRRVPIEFLRPNPLNPRQSFPEAELEELTASIRERDIIQPLIVRGVAGIRDAFESAFGIGSLHRCCKVIALQKASPVRTVT